MEDRKRKLIIYGIAGVFALFVVIWTAMGRMQAPTTLDSIGTWFAAFLTLCILSFLYNDNPFYKFAESLFIGISAGYWMVQGIWESIIKNLLGKVLPSVASHLVNGIKDVSIGERLWYMLPLIMGIMLLWRLAPKGGWISRWPLALIVGWAAGTNLVRYLESDFAKQITPTMRTIVVVQNGSVLWLPTFSAIIAVFGLLAALIYFFFSVEHKGIFGKTSKVGIWILMITFGAAFGYTVMGRIALLVGRVEFLFIDWLRVFGT